MNRALSSCVVYFCLAFAFGKNEDTHTLHKRLLLNDPDIAATRLANVEAAVQLLKGTVSKLEAGLQAEKNKNAEHEINISQMTSTLKKLQDQGSTYIQWGKTSCSSIGTETIYSGYVAGQLFYSSSSYQNRFGGPANTLCLPNNPKLSNRTTQSYSFIYGAEFEENFLRSDAINENIPCAFCRSLNTTSSSMFPGRNICYSDWKIEYEGYIMSGYWGHRASTYICVDAHPDYVHGGKADEIGQRFYVTSTKCGSLSCPPYHDNLAVNCVVCSK
ncbi:unnamed protein product [Mytilus edulis]|uniref:Short-chain collagen C4 n=1 Tax=Mytilus edulis TaxID=6550 RepID=A0A8S3QRL3_MYTED|nr:unnamed protein product [Mytilus edulis]